MSYDHTQKAPLHLIFYPIVVVLLVLAWIGRDQQPVVLCSTLGVALTLVLVALMFKQLTVRDEGECLAIRFGPLPVFRKLIPYSDMSSVEPGRSAMIDGWGIHWIPGRGFTYNLWGFDCAILMVKGRIIRVGSDDAENLVTFLREKVSTPSTVDEAGSEVGASDDGT